MEKIKWPKKRRIEIWPLMGETFVWVSKCREFRISKCQNYGSVHYIGCYRVSWGWKLICRARTLMAAKKKIQKFLQE